MTAKTDDLLGLFSICEGHVSVNINPHTTDYQTVERYLDDLDKRAPGMVKNADKLEMIERNKIVHIRFCAKHPGPKFSVYAGSVHGAAVKAFSLAKHVLGKEDLKLDPVEGKLTKLLERLGNTCKAEIHLNLNEYKSNRWGETKDHGKTRTLKDWFDFNKTIHPDRYEPDEKGHVDYPQELVDWVIRQGNMLEIHFYPNTPVSFYTFFGSDYRNILDNAVRLAKRDVTEFERFKVLEKPKMDVIFGTPVPKLDPNDFTILDGLRKMY